MMRRPFIILNTLCLALCLSACSGGSSGSGGATPSTQAVTPPSTPAPTTPTAPTTPPGTPAPSTPTPPASNQPLKTGVLKLLSYNVAGLPQIISSVNPVANTIQISPHLNGYELVLVQEDFAYHPDLSSAAIHPYQSTPQTGVSTLVNDGLNRFSDSSFTDFSRSKWNDFHGIFNSGSDGLSSKGFSVARHSLDNGVVIDVYNLHCDAGRGSGDKNARQSQLNQLKLFVQSFSAGKAIIMAGDTNLKASDADDEAMLVAFMQDLGLTASARHLGITPDLIDRVMVRSSQTIKLEPIQWRKASEFVNSNGDPLSDHHAVHVDIAWELWP